MMADLSNAAQKVNRTVLALHPYGVARDVALPSDLAVAAAVLRSVANQLRDAYANEEYIDSADDFLDDIAAELEGLQ